VPTPTRAEFEHLKAEHERLAGEVERLREQLREQTKELRIQFTRIAELQAILDEHRVFNEREAGAILAARVRQT